MLYNKRQFNKTNDKKVLHKVGKHWMAISLATLMAIGGFSAVKNVSAHAATDTGNTDTSNTNTLKERLNSSLEKTSSNQNQSNSQATAQKNAQPKVSTQAIDNQASALHNRILANATHNVGATNNAGQGRVANNNSSNNNAVNNSNSSNGSNVLSQRIAQTTGYNAPTLGQGPTSPNGHNAGGGANAGGGTTQGSQQAYSDVPVTVAYANPNGMIQKHLNASGSVSDNISESSVTISGNSGANSVSMTNISSASGYTLINNSSANKKDLLSANISAGSVNWSAASNSYYNYSKGDSDLSIAPNNANPNTKYWANWDTTHNRPMIVFTPAQNATSMVVNYVNESGSLVSSASLTSTNLANDYNGAGYGDYINVWANHAVNSNFEYGELNSNGQPLYYSAGNTTAHNMSDLSKASHANTAKFTSNVSQVMYQSADNSFEITSEKTSAAKNENGQLIALTPNINSDADYVVNSNAAGEGYTKGWYPITSSASTEYITVPVTGKFTHDAPNDTNRSTANNSNANKLNVTLTLHDHNGASSAYNTTVYMNSATGKGQIGAKYAITPADFQSKSESVQIGTYTVDNKNPNKVEQLKTNGGKTITANGQQLDDGTTFNLPAGSNFSNSLSDGAAWVPKAASETKVESGAFANAIVTAFGGFSTADSGFANNGFAASNVASDDIKRFNYSKTGSNAAVASTADTHGNKNVVTISGSKYYAYDIKEPVASLVANYTNSASNSANEFYLSADEQDTKVSSKNGVIPGDNASAVIGVLNNGNFTASSNVTVNFSAADNYSPAASKIHVQYINQNGAYINPDGQVINTDKPTSAADAGTINANSSDYSKVIDITNGGKLTNAKSDNTGIHVPDGYKLNYGQNTNQVVNDQDQTIQLFVTGEPVAQNITVKPTIYKDGREQTNNKSITIKVSGKVGDKLVLNANDLLKNNNNGAIQGNKSELQGAGNINTSSDQLSASGSTVLKFKPILKPITNQQGETIGYHYSDDNNGIYSTNAKNNGNKNDGDLLTSDTTTTDAQTYSSSKGYNPIINFSVTANSKGTLNNAKTYLNTIKYVSISDINRGAGQSIQPSDNDTINWANGNVYNSDGTPIRKFDNNSFLTTVTTAGRPKDNFDPKSYLTNVPEGYQAVQVLSSTNGGYALNNYGGHTTGKYTDPSNNAFSSNPQSEVVEVVPDASNIHFNYYDQNGKKIKSVVANGNAQKGNTTQYLTKNVGTYYVDSKNSNHVQKFVDNGGKTITANGQTLSNGKTFYLPQGKTFTNHLTDGANWAQQPVQKNKVLQSYSDATVLKKNGTYGTSPISPSDGAYTTNYGKIINPSDINQIVSDADTSHLGVPDGYSVVKTQVDGNGYAERYSDNPDSAQNNNPENNGKFTHYQGQGKIQHGIAFSRDPQTVNIMLVGNKLPDGNASDTAHITIHELDPNGNQTNQYTVSDNVPARIGDNFNIDGSNYIPGGYYQVNNYKGANEPTSVNENVTQGGLSHKDIDFFYQQKADHNVNDLTPVDVYFQNGNNIVANEVLKAKQGDYSGQSVNISDSDALTSSNGQKLLGYDNPPKGYQVVAHQNMNTNLSTSTTPQVYVQVYNMNQETSGVIRIQKNLMTSDGRGNDTNKRVIYSDIAETGQKGTSTKLNPSDYQVDGYAESNGQHNSDKDVTVDFGNDGTVTLSDGSNIDRNDKSQVDWNYYAENSQNSKSNPKNQDPNNPNKPFNVKPKNPDQPGPVGPKTSDAEPIYVQYYVGRGTNDPIEISNSGISNENNADAANHKGDLRVDGTMDQTFSDISKAALKQNGITSGLTGSDVPNNYHFIGQPKLDYSVTNQEQQVDLHINPEKPGDSDQIITVNYEAADPDGNPIYIKSTGTPATTTDSTSALSDGSGSKVQIGTQPIYAKNGSVTSDISDASNYNKDTHDSSGVTFVGRVPGAQKYYLKNGGNASDGKTTDPNDAVKYGNGQPVQIKYDNDSFDGQPLYASNDVTTMQKDQAIKDGSNPIKVGTFNGKSVYLKSAQNTTTTTSDDALKDKNGKAIQIGTDNSGKPLYAANAGTTEDASQALSVSDQGTSAKVPLIAKTVSLAPKQVISDGNSVNINASDYRPVNYASDTKMNNYSAVGLTNNSAVLDNSHYVVVNDNGKLYVQTNDGHGNVLNKEIPNNDLNFYYQVNSHNNVGVQPIYVNYYNKQGKRLNSETDVVNGYMGQKYSDIINDTNKAAYNYDGGKGNVPSVYQNAQHQPNLAPNQNKTYTIGNEPQHVDLVVTGAKVTNANYTIELHYPKNPDGSGADQTKSDTFTPNVDYGSDFSVDPSHYAPSGMSVVPSSQQPNNVDRDVQVSYDQSSANGKADFNPATKTINFYYYKAPSNPKTDTEPLTVQYVDNQNGQSDVINSGTISGIGEKGKYISDVTKDIPYDNTDYQLNPATQDKSYKFNTIQNAYAKASDTTTSPDQAADKNSPLYIINGQNIYRKAGSKASDSTYTTDPTKALTNGSTKYSDPYQLQQPVKTLYVIGNPVNPNHSSDGKHDFTVNLVEKNLEGHTHYYTEKLPINSIPTSITSDPNKAFKNHSDQPIKLQRLSSDGHTEQPVMIETHDSEGHATGQVQAYLSAKGSYNYRIGQKVTINASDFTPMGYSTTNRDLPQTVTINKNSDDPSDGIFFYDQNANNYSGNITLHYMNQNGQYINSDGSVAKDTDPGYTGYQLNSDSEGGHQLLGQPIDITNGAWQDDGFAKGVNVPQGYSLDSGQKTNYQFNSGNQNVTLMVQGSPVTPSDNNSDNLLTIHLHTNKRIYDSASHQFKNTSDVQTVHEYINSDLQPGLRRGDTYIVNPSKFTPKGYFVKPGTGNVSDYKNGVTGKQNISMSDASQKVQLGQDGKLYQSDGKGGLTNNNVVNFNYDSVNNRAGDLTLKYVNQAGNQVGYSDVISGNIGSDISDVTKGSDGGESVPAGYTLDNPNGTNQKTTGYTLSQNPQTVVLKVNGNNVQNKLQINRVITHSDGTITTDTVAAPNNLLKSDAVGNTYEVDPADYMPGATVGSVDNAHSKYSVNYTRAGVQNVLIQPGNDTWAVTPQEAGNNTKFTHTVTFYYDDNTVNAKPITVRFVNQNGQLVGGSTVVQGNQGDAIGATTNSADFDSGHNALAATTKNNYSDGQPNRLQPGNAKGDSALVPKGYKLDQTGQPNAVTFSNSPQTLTLHVTGNEYDQDFNMNVVTENSDGSQSKTTPVTVHIHAHVGDNVKISPYGFNVNSGTNNGIESDYETSDKSTNHTANNVSEFNRNGNNNNFQVPAGYHATNSDSDVNESITSDGNLTPLKSVNFNYQRSYGKTQLGHIVVHYITSDNPTVRDVNTGSLIQKTIGGHTYNQVDQESDTGVVNDPSQGVTGDNFDLSPYADDIPEQLANSFYTTEKAGQSDSRKQKSDSPVMDANGDQIRSSDYATTNHSAYNNYFPTYENKNQDGITSDVSQANTNGGKPVLEYDTASKYNSNGQTPTTTDPTKAIGYNPNGSTDRDKLANVQQHTVLGTANYYVLVSKNNGPIIVD